MNYAQSRMNMIENQVRANHVSDSKILDAMAQVPREIFVPMALKNVAYIDSNIEVAQGRFIMAPMVLAQILEFAHIQPSDIVLEIGCATGYSSAVISNLASTVVALEQDEELANLATQTLYDMGADNAVVVSSPHALGYNKQAPYDVIILNGCVDEIPESIKDQLSDDGRLLACVGGNALMGQVVLYTKKAENLSKRVLMEAALKPLAGFENSDNFSL
jgi:protein-L-isoaspartate(D-aspartate) O-methyltransferase